MMQTTIRALYIEDDPGTAELVRLHLEPHNIRVTVVHDGDEGLALCQREVFDVVLVDHTLEHRNGVDVVRALQKNSDFSPAIVMVTGTGDEMVAVEAMKAGADDYIVKDVDGSYLLLLIEVILKALDRRDLVRNKQLLQEEQKLLIQDLQSFSFAVAHDLKQPLTVFAASLDLLEHYIKAKDDERTSRRLAQLQTIVLKLAGTIDSLILLAQIRETPDVDFGGCRRGATCT